MADKKISTVWSDLDFRLIQDAAGNLKKAENVAAVMTSLDNILRTYKGERVMLPSFASNLRNLMFEGMNETLMKFVSKEIKDNIEIWDNRIKIVEVAIIFDPDSSSISINLSFAIKGWSDIFQYETTIKGA